MRDQIITQHYNQNKKKLINIVSKRLDNNFHVAEEAVHEAYARALRYIDCCDFEDAGFDRWFATILNNAVKDASKDERNRGMSLEEVCELGDAYSETKLKNSWGKLFIKHEISATKNYLHRNILHLFFNKGLTYYDIHCITDINSESMARQVIKRFRNHMVEKYK